MNTKDVMSIRDKLNKSQIIYHHISKKSFLDALTQLLLVRVF